MTSLTNLRPSGSREAGFTIVELLIVLMIISIIASIGISSAFRAFDTSRLGRTVANMRGASDAILKYQTDTSSLPGGGLQPVSAIAAAGPAFRRKHRPEGRLGPRDLLRALHDRPGTSHLPSLLLRQGRGLRRRRHGHLGRFLHRHRHRGRYLHQVPVVGERRYCHGEDERASDELSRCPGSQARGVAGGRRHHLLLPHQEVPEHPTEEEERAAPEGQACLRHAAARLRSPGEEAASGPREPPLPLPTVAVWLRSCSWSWWPCTTARSG